MNKIRHFGTIPVCALLIEADNIRLCFILATSQGNDMCRCSRATCEKQPLKAPDVPSTARPRITLRPKEINLPD